MRPRQIQQQPTLRPTRTPLPSAQISSNQPTINVRASDTTDSEIVTVLNNGAVVTILGQNDDRSWVHVRTDSTDEGWIAAFLLDVETPISTTSSSNSVVTVSTSRPTNPPTVCRPDFEKLGGSLRLTNSFEDDDYGTYTYNVTTRRTYTEYSLSVSVGEEWIGAVSPVFDTSDNYQGQLRINGIVVDYVYDGDFGYESILFSFEFGDLKYSGDIGVFDDIASPDLRPLLHEDIENFINLIKRC